MNILVTLDRNYLPPLRVMLGSLLRNDPGETFEIYAIGDGLLPEDWAALEELCAGRGRIHPLEVPADLFADAPPASVCRRRGCTASAPPGGRTGTAGPWRRPSPRRPSAST